MVPSTVSVNDNVCPKNVKDRTLGLNRILSPARAPVTEALYVETGVPTFVTTRLKIQVKLVSEGEVERAKEG